MHLVDFHLARAEQEGLNPQSNSSRDTIPWRLASVCHFVFFLNRSLRSLAHCSFAAPQLPLSRLLVRGEWWTCMWLKFIMSGKCIFRQSWLSKEGPVQVQGFARTNERKSREMQATQRNGILSMGESLHQKAMATWRQEVVVPCGVPGAVHECSSHSCVPITVVVCKAHELVTDLQVLWTL